MFRKIIPILLVITWLFVIFNFSSQEGKVSQSQSLYITNYIYKNHDEVVKDIDNGIIHYFIRKSAHIILYFILCIFIINALYYGGFKGKGLFIRASIISFFYACMDETYQRFTKGRSGRLVDVFIDGIGIILAIAIVFVIGRAYNIKKNRE